MRSVQKWFWCLGVFLSSSFVSISSYEKVVYPFTSDPIDVVIPCDLKDQRLLDRCIEGIKGQCSQVRRVIVISKVPLTKRAEWFDENLFPFQKTEVALALFHQNKEAALRYMSGWNRLGWIYQQLLKLYAVQVIPDISPNVLVLDSDTIFLNPVTFTNSEGEPFLTLAGEYHLPYFEHMKRLLPWLERYNSYSGIAHHMLFQRCVIEDLFRLIEERHQMPAWQALCACTAEDQLYGSSLSEYEIYFNFILHRTDQVHLQKLTWDNISSVNKIEKYRNKGYQYVSCHSWQRRDDE